MDKTLLPCPFCGGIAKLYEGDDNNRRDDWSAFHVICNDCFASCSIEEDELFNLFKKEVIRKWNYRKK